MEELAELIKTSSEVILITSEDKNDIVMLDIKTLGILETYIDES